MKCLQWIFLVLIIVPSVSWAQESKFVAKAAVVDVESILEHSLAIKHVKKSINEISDKIQRELTEKEINMTITRIIWIRCADSCYSRRALDERFPRL